MGKDVGTNKAVTVSGLTLEKNAASNYTLTGADGAVFAEPAVAVQLDEAGDQPVDVVRGVGPRGMAGQLDALVGGQVVEGFLQQPVAFAFELFDLGAQVPVVGGGFFGKLADLLFDFENRDLEVVRKPILDVVFGHGRSDAGTGETATCRPPL